MVHEYLKSNSNNDVMKNNELSEPKEGHVAENKSKLNLEVFPGMWQKYFNQKPGNRDGAE